MLLKPWVVVIFVRLASTKRVWVVGEDAAAAAACCWIPLDFGDGRSGGQPTQSNLSHSCALIGRGKIEIKAQLQLIGSTNN